MGQRHHYGLHVNRELLALGLSNLMAGVSRSFCVGASQSRTLLNSSTGGTTQMVSYVAAALLVGFVAFLSPWIETLPMVAIAAILVFTALTLIDVQGLQHLWRLHKGSAWLAACTSIGVIAFGVLPGILVGVVISLLHVISQLSHPKDALLGRVPGSGAIRDLADDEVAAPVPGLLIYRFYGPLIFANVRYFIERLNALLARADVPVRQILLDARAITDIDVTAADQLRTFASALRQKNMSIVVAKASRPLRKAAMDLGFADVLEQGTYFHRLSDAVAAFESNETSRSLAETK
jgi:SulP family sulfate permease